MSELNQLMTRLNISSVYWIDDENAKPDELDTEMLLSHVLDNLIDADKEDARKSIAVALTSNNSRNEISKFNQIINADEDSDSKKTRLENKFKEFSETYAGDLKTLLKEIIAQLPQALSEEERSVLSGLFKSDNFPWDLKTKSFNDWNNNHTDILADTDPTKSYLFIVDLQNKTENTNIDGRTVITQIWNKAANTNNLYVLVLTSQCTQKNELLEARKLTDELAGTTTKIKIPLFMVSKSRFSGDIDTKSQSITNSFVSVLSRMKLSILHIHLSDSIKDQIKNSVDSAFAMLEQLTIEELLHAVTLSSSAEGVSEIDTLIRLINIAQRQALSEKIITDSSLRNTLLEMRGIEHDLETEHLPKDKTLIKFRASELYDDGTVVNSLYSPLKPGDIFEFINSNQQKNYYVLVANSCDLMLRGSDGKRKLDFGFLLPLTPRLNNKEIGKQDFELPHIFIESEGKKIDLSGYLPLNRFITVPLEVLDLCWTNTNGNCKWLSKDGISSILGVIGAQRKRWEIIDAFFSSLKSEESLEMCVKESSINFKYKVKRKRHVYHVKSLIAINFNIRRVARLSYSHASQLVIRFAGVIGRPSAEYDYTKSIQ